MKTLIIVSHPYPEQSNVILHLEKIARELPDTTVRNLESLYGNKIDAFDVAAEQLACENVDRIVFLFPIHWFNLTPMLKGYLNTVWTYGWAFGPNGTALKDKKLLAITSAGASEFTYSHEGIIQSTKDEILSHLKASALYVGMKYLEPIMFHNALGASSEQIETFEKKFVQALTV